MSGRFAKLLLLILLGVQLVGLACSTTSVSGPTIVTIEVTPNSAEVQAGATQLYAARALDGSGNQILGVSFTWSSADESIATVDANGTATGVVLGVTEVRASASGRTGSGRISVVPNTNADLPDDQFLDSNGDGIDGDIAKAVFVATTGNDANDGTPDNPKLTIAAAITAAAGDATKTEVYVSSGTYMEVVQLSAGVSVYGGYDAAADWARSASNVATVQGDTTAVIADGITQATTVDRLTIESADNTVAGGNSTGIYLANSNGGSAPTPGWEAWELVQTAETAATGPPRGPQEMASRGRSAQVVVLVRAGVEAPPIRPATALRSSPPRTARPAATAGRSGMALTAPPAMGWAVS
jgi:hypothetical protein